MMTDKEKLTALIDHYAGGSQSRFAELIGVPRSNVATWMHRGSITANGREAILDAFPQVDRDWLAEGGAEVEEWDGVPRDFPGVFHGGPPCQSNSVAANQRFSKNRCYSDRHWRLFLQYLRR